MTPPRLCLLLTLMAALLAPLPVGASASDVTIRNEPTHARQVMLHRNDAGALEYVVTWNDQRVETYTPDAFAQLIHDDLQQRSGIFAFLNITSPTGMAWVGLGLLGQILFTGRMVLQWLVSERAKQSTVPVAFWWMSLLGASMLIVYFIWRRDAVGVLGQATGWFIYVRNLMLIYGRHGRAAREK